MVKAHETVVAEQFGPRAQAYLESAVHARGADLEALEAMVRAAAPGRALDLGAGGGHVSYLMAPHAGTVTAVDLSADMLATVAAAARARGFANIETVAAPAERLPLRDAAFDFLACRFSAHHWRHFERGLGEARRVLKAGAPAVFIDAYAPGGALLDTHLQAVELLRDPSHVRDYSLGEWIDALGRAGFQVTTIGTWRLRMEFATWTARMRTPELHQQAIRALQAAASAEVRGHFEIEPDGSFQLDIAMLRTVAA